MGSAVSREEVLAIPQAVGLKVKDLGVFLRTVGDEEAGKLLKDLCNSPDLLTLHNKLIHEASRSQQPTIGKTSDKELELRRFVSSEGQRLSEDEITHVLCAVGNWIRDGSDTNRQNDLKAWRQDPSIFCTGRSRQSSSEPIGIYFDEYEQIERSQNLNATRRKVLLLFTFKAVRDEELRLRRHKHKGKNFSAAKFRTRAIDELTRRAWGHLKDEEVKRRRQKLTRMSTYGQKWNLIQPASMVLSLRGMSKYFEQQKWSEIEIEAINTFLQAKLSSIAVVQDGTMAAITSEWPQPLHPQTVRSPTQIHPDSTSPSSIEPIPEGMQSLLNALHQDPFLNDAEHITPAHETQTSLLAGNEVSMTPQTAKPPSSYSPVLFDPWGNAIPLPTLVSPPTYINPWGSATLLSFPGWGIDNVLSTQGQLPAWEDGTTNEYVQQSVTGLGWQCNETLVPTIHSQ